MITRRLLISGFPVLGLTGCAIAVGRRFQTLEPVQDEQAHIYFLRSESAKTGIYPDIYMNGRFAGSLKRGGYLFERISPGKIEISIPATITWWPMEAFRKEINVEGGNRYFLNLHTSEGGITEKDKRRIIAVDVLRLVSEEVAVPVLRQAVLSR